MLTASPQAIKCERLSPATTDRADSTSPILSSGRPGSGGGPAVFACSPSPRLGLGPVPAISQLPGAVGPNAYERATAMAAAAAAGLFPADFTGPPAGIPAGGLFNFGTGCTNYSDFIRGLAAKYNNSNNDR